MSGKASWLDALLGALFDDGDELELIGGLNFVGFTLTPNVLVNSLGESVQVYDIAVAGAATTSDNVSNESGVSGSTVSDALDALATLIGTNTTNIATNTSSISTLNGRQIIAGTNMSGGGTLAADRTLSLAAALTGVDSINGAKVAAPVQGTAVTTTATINVSGGNNYDVTAASAYTLTLGTSGSPITGEIISLRTTNSLANAITITNGGGGGGNIGPSSGTLPASVKGVYDFRYDGTNWVYAGMKRCS